MNRKLFSSVLILISVLALVGVACNLSSLASKVGGSATSIGSLWSDVPQMDGLTKSDQNLPLEAKLIMQGYFAAASKGQGSFDFITYTTSSSPADVSAYYTVDRMGQSGWQTNDQIGCNTFAASTATPGSNSSGAICIFAKDEDNNKGAMLAIFAAPDDKNAAQTNVYFARVEVTNLTPQATQ
jgi:hypothetical protein